MMANYILYAIGIDRVKEVKKAKKEKTEETKIWN